MDKVSVIVPVYNIEQYLEECIDSIIHQTYEALEIILVDDGSTDLSSTICDKYKKIDNRIKVIHKENAGLASARNTGIKMSTGEFIIFVDGDDKIKINTIETLFFLLKDYNCDISMVLSQLSPYLSNEIMVNNSEEMLLHILYISSFEVWGKLFKRELFDNITFPEGKILEDLYTIPKILAKSKKVVMQHSSLYYYRQRKGSIMDELKVDLSKEVCDCVSYNLKEIQNMKEQGLISEENFDEIQQWFLFHPLWYFYNEYCAYPNKRSKKFEKSLKVFYKRNLILYFRNKKIGLKDKMRLLFIAISPSLVCTYNNKMNRNTKK